MKKIGNIFFKTKLVNHTKVDYINYYDLNDHNDDIDYDDTVPSLYVGWQLTKECFMSSTYFPSILEKEIKSQEYYWEFSFEEKKEEHISGVELFVRNVPYYYFRFNYKYKNIDPIINNIVTNDDLIRKLPHTTSNIIYNYKNEMLYLLYDKKIYGIDLNMYEFFSFSKNEIIELVKERTEKYIDDLNTSIYAEYYKTYPNFEDLKRYLVVLLSKA